MYFRNWIILTPDLKNPTLEPWDCLLKCFTAGVFWSLSTCVSYKGKKNRIGWYSRPFQVYIYIINKLYWSQDGISKSLVLMLTLVVTIYFSWQGRESDFLVETAKFVEMDPIMKQKSSREINNKKKSFHTSQTLLLKFKYQILE